MKKYLVYTELFGTRYFIGIFNTLKQAKEILKKYNGAKIEVYEE